MGRRVVRALTAVVILAGILVTHPVRLSGACTTGTITSPQGIFNALEPSTSGDGRYTVFYTLSPLVPTDTNNETDVYVVDRLTCALEVVSVSTLGDQGNNPSSYASISADGQMVAFMSTANNLVPNDTNVGVDVFVRSRAGGTTIRASVKTNGGQAVAGSDRPKISANGQVVAFRSFANDLVPGNVTGAFVRDLAAGTTELVSAGADIPAISADGRYVAFSSLATDLVPGDTNNAADVFRYDRQTSTTIRVSVQTGGAQGPTGGSRNPSISGDGSVIAFDYLGGPPLIPGGHANGVYVHDVNTVTTELVNVAIASHSGATRPTISSNGRYVAFAGAPGLVLGDAGGNLNVYVRDRLTGVTRRVSTTPNGIAGDLFSPSLGIPDISGDGMVVAFQSNSTNLVPGDTNGRDDVFIVDWRFISVPPNLNLMRNGSFSTGTGNWLQFATPDMTYIDFNVTGGVFQYNRLVPPPGTTNQAVVFQQTTAQLLAGAPIAATFQLGNSSTARRRISVLIHDQDFTDLSVCTFWLPAATALQTYAMRTHTTKVWAGATISFYAATAGADGGFNRIDNVTLMYAPALADDETDCVDPLAPAAPGGAPGPTLVTNGDFSGGLAPWGLFGQIVSQITSGVFEFYRPAGTPAGVVLQSTGQAMTAGQILTATFDLGNTSNVRKRVTALLHDELFGDLMACTFWLPPNTPLQTFLMRGYATIAWANATLSVYPATVGTDQWIQLDNVVFQPTPGTAITGTKCLEPSALGPIAHGAPTPRPGGVAFGSTSDAPGRTGSADVRRRRASALRNIDDSDPPFARLSFGQTFVQYWLPPGAEFLIQISDDGETWHTVCTVGAGEAWRRVDVDLSAAAEEALYVRVIRRN